MKIKAHGPGKWRLWWELGRDPITGERRQETKVVRAKNRTEAEVAWRKHQAQLDGGHGKDPSRRAVADLMVAWYDWRTTGPHPLRGSTAALYRTMLDRYVLPELGGELLQRVTPLRMQRAVDAWARMKKERGGGYVSARTVKLAATLCHAAYQQAVRWEWTTHNPVTALEYPAGTPRGAQWWDAATTAHFLAETTRHPYWGAWTLAVLTGLRQGELLGLRWVDIDGDTGTCTVMQQREHSGVPAFGEPKTARSKRTLVLHPDARGVLATIAEDQAHARQRLGAHWTESGLVVTTRLGTPVSPRNLLRSFTLAQERVGVAPRITWHDLRHTHATLLRAAGADWRVIADRLGHSQVYFTAQTYLHADLAAQEEALTKLPALLPKEDAPE